MEDTGKVPKEIEEVSATEPTPELESTSEDLLVAVEEEKPEKPKIEQTGIRSWHASISKEQSEEILKDWFRQQAQVPDHVEVYFKSDVYGYTLKFGAREVNGEGAKFDFYQHERGY